MRRTPSFLTVAVILCLICIGLCQDFFLPFIAGGCR